MSDGYREAHAIGKARYEHIDIAAHSMLDALELEQTGTNLEQAKVLATALALFAERNTITPDAWRSAGYLGNLLNASGKVGRLMANLWYKTGENGRTEKPIDNALDGITYLSFFVRMYEIGNERGNQPGAS